MKVYIEYVIVDNMIINSIVGILSLRALKLKVSAPRILLSAALGTVYSIFFPSLKLPYAVNIVLKVLSGMSLCFILLKRFSFKRFITLFLCFLFITFLLGGAIFAILFFLGANFYDITSFAHDYKFPVSLVILAAFIIGVILRRLFVTAHRSNDAERYIRRAQISYGGRQITVDAFIDSGNSLYDIDSGLPVIVVNANSFINLLDEEQARQFLLGRGLPGARYMPFSTLSGKNNKMLVVKPEKVVLYSKTSENTIYDVMLGISRTGFKGTAVYQAILHPSLET